MRLAVVSDLHLGAPSSRLVLCKEEPFRIGEDYDAFKDAVGKGNDYLILLGDVFDLSVAGFDTVYKAAKVFFRKVREDRLADQVIYVPGNHDFSVWNLLAQQINVIKQVEDGDPVRTSLAKTGVLKEAPVGKENPLTLWDAHPDPETKRFGGLFLDHLACDDPPTPDTCLPFNVAFPNLYFVPENGCTVLMTHGHFFERYWSLAGEVAVAVAGEDMQPPNPKVLSIEDWCRLNCPLNELASASLGQTGPLVPIVNGIQQDVGEHKVARLKRYMGNAVRFLDAEIRGSLITEVLSDTALRILERFALRKLSDPGRARHDRDFFERRDVRIRIRDYLLACEMERARMLTLPNPVSVPVPEILLCGHTHEPIGMDPPVMFDEPGVGQPVQIRNSGGWLPHADETQPFPGAVFRYDSVAGWSFVRVAAPQGGGG
jgi:predicted phosphodiesterase